MENASKALLMAAGVLIGILILSLAVFLFANFGAASAEAHKQNEENQIEQFNVQFTAYQGRKDITIHDIVTVANLAKSTNQSFGLTEQTPNNYYITVSAQGLGQGNKNKYKMENLSSQELDDLVKEELEELEHLVNRDDGNENTYYGLPTYSCNVTINQNTRRVSAVNFKRNN